MDDVCFHDNTLESVLVIILLLIPVSLSPSAAAPCQKRKKKNVCVCEWGAGRTVINSVLPFQINVP